jgi:signal transduction histidine kinase/CheY-like chemotaxis protein
MTSADDLFAALDVALFEHHAAGGFHPIGAVPPWLPTTGNLTDDFPLLELFLSGLEANWTGQSDIWTEPHPIDPIELYLQAVAATLGGRQFIAIRSMPPELFTYQQLAHDFQLAEQKVEKLNVELQRATQAKSDFLATMSHEIRTPLNAIIGMADVLSGTPLTPEQKRCVDIFQRNGVALLTLINDILDLSKVESGHVELESIDFDLRDVVARAMEVVEGRSSAKGLYLRRAIAPEVPNYLTGDPNRLRQVIINLLGNSIKFTEQGGLEVLVALDDGRLRFGIRDTGIGIPAGKLSSIFESFTQVDASTTRKYGGTGLGLTISKQLVELMHGRIWVESTLGEGSTFYFTASLGVQENQMDRSEIPLAKANIQDLESRLAGTRILLADDSEDNRYLIVSYLSRAQTVIEIAENGQIAAEKFKAGKYDVVLMDVEMPVMDGPEATAEIRSHETKTGAAPTPVLALTAHAFTEMTTRTEAPNPEGRRAPFNMQAHSPEGRRAPFNMEAHSPEGRRAPFNMEAGFTAILTKPIRKVTLLEALLAHAPTQTAPAPSNTGQPATAGDPVAGAFIQPHKTLIPVEPGMEDAVPPYLEKRRTDVSLYRAALAANDFDSIKKLAHKMKGTGAGYGFQTLTDLGATLERAAIDGNAPQIALSLDELAVYLESIELKYS